MSLVERAKIAEELELYDEMVKVSCGFCISAW